MRIIARKTLVTFVQSLDGHKDHQAVKSALDAWFAEVRRASWASSADVKRLYTTANIVTASRVVFNIRGNHYRLVVSINYAKQIVWINWVGNHQDYDEIDVRSVRHGK